MNLKHSGIHPKQRTTPKLTVSKLTDIVIQIVYIVAIDPAEPKSSCLILGLGLLPRCHSGSFEKLSKASGSKLLTKYASAKW